MTNLRLITLLLPVFFLNACAQPPRAIISQVDEGQRSFVTSSAETSTTYLKAEGIIINSVRGLAGCHLQ